MFRGQTGGPSVHESPVHETPRNSAAASPWGCGHPEGWTVGHLPYTRCSGQSSLRGRELQIHCAPPPDFLSRFVALMICMRLSLRRAADVVVAGSAK
jgi:hypothetical protein